MAGCDMITPQLLFPLDSLLNLLEDLLLVVPHVHLGFLHKVINLLRTVWWLECGVLFPLFSDIVFI